MGGEKAADPSKVSEKNIYKQTRKNEISGAW